MTPMEIAKDHLQRDIVALCRDLGLEGRARNGILEGARNPGRNDRHPGSFIVWLSPDRAGNFRDYAADEYKGDVVDLVCLCKGFSRSEVLAWARDRYGLARLTDGERKRLAERQVRKAERARVDSAAQLARMAERARRTFYGSPYEIRDPEAAIARRYFSGRGIDVAAIKNLEPKSFRFRPAMEWWRGAARDGEGRKVKPGPHFPAIVSAMRDGEGKLRACHCTFLAADGAAKADVEKPKLVTAATAGLAIRVATGLSGLPVEEAVANGAIDTLALTEGIEDALSVAAALPELRVWAVGSLPGLLSVPDTAAADAFLVYRDNDWGKPGATELFERAVERIRNFGKPLEVVASPWGKDANDLLRGET